MQIALSIMWKTYLKLFIIIPILCLNSANGANLLETPNMNIPVKKTLTVAQHDKRLILRFAFENTATFDVFVLKDAPSVFITCNGQDIDEIGPSEKRKPYTIADYELVSPGKSTLRTLEITERFAWLPGKHKYITSVSGDYKDPTNQQIWKASRLSVEFTWSK